MATVARARSSRILRWVKNGAPPAIKRLLSVSFFLILGLAALLWFGVSMSTLVSQLVAESPVVAFDKGAMYMLGVGSALLLLAAGGFLHGVMGKKQTKAGDSIFKRGVIVCFLVLIVFPQAAQYVVNRYAIGHSYQICESAGYRWLLYSKYYYTKDDSECDRLGREKHSHSERHKVPDVVAKYFRSPSFEFFSRSASLQSSAC